MFEIELELWYAAISDCFTLCTSGAARNCSFNSISTHDRKKLTAFVCGQNSEKGSTACKMKECIEGQR